MPQIVDGFLEDLVEPWERWWALLRIGRTKRMEKSESVVYRLEEVEYRHGSYNDKSGMGLPFPGFVFSLLPVLSKTLTVIHTFIHSSVFPAIDIHPSGTPSQETRSISVSSLGPFSCGMTTGPGKGDSTARGWSRETLTKNISPSLIPSFLLIFSRLVGEHTATLSSSAFKRAFDGGIKMPHVDVTLGGIRRNLTCLDLFLPLRRPFLTIWGKYWEDGMDRVDSDERGRGAT